jgi:hypothetical protein
MQSNDLRLTVLEEDSIADEPRIPLFYVIPGFRLPLVLLGEQEVNGRWVKHDRTELAQFPPFDEDAVYWMLEQVREYTHLGSKPHTSARTFTTHRPRHRAPVPPLGGIQEVTHVYLSQLSLQNDIGTKYTQS